MGNERVCPWWMGYLLACPIRRFLQDPAKIVTPYVREGMLVLEPGPGMGFFTLELARRVGETGRVVVVDIQPRMLAALRRRAERAGFRQRVETRLAQQESMQIADLSHKVDFALAFAVVHEMPNAGVFFREVGGALRPGGTALVVEPAGHVSTDKFDLELKAAADAGLAVVDRPQFRRSHAAVLERS
jgi:ubiquinone/menaquinone biosynthesis C-methylase UbiE